MADQSASETIADTADPGVYGVPSHAHEASHGRPVSWVVTTLVVVGFVIGGIALPIGPVWWLFWTGAAIVVIAALMGAAIHIFDDWY